LGGQAALLDHQEALIRTITDRGRAALKKGS
jgi:hypothetical protein